MAKTKISEFSATPGNNTDIDGINIAEGCAPSGINNAIRELMSQLKDFQAGTAGDSFNGPVGTSTAAAGAFTTLTTSSTVTHNAGTANGVAYLNGSKVLTTGSALTFDGSQLDIPLGSAAAPSLSTPTDPNTGIFFPAADTIAFAEGGVESARFDSAGNLGIGTSSPASRLHVAGSFRQTGATVPFEWTVNAGAQDFYKLNAVGFADNLIVANSAGNVGIGTSSPAVKLDVVGSGKFTGITEFTNAINLTTSTLNYVYFNDAIAFSRNGTGERMRIDSSGNLGLGVTPSAWAGKALQVTTFAGFGASADGDLIAGNNCYNSASGVYRYTASSLGSSLYMQTFGNHKWYIAPSGTAGNAISFTQAMTLDASGNLGVGTTSPSALGLQVSKGSGVAAGLLLSNANNNWSISCGASTNALIFTDNQFAERARIDSSGNLLVGTTSNPPTARILANVTTSQNAVAAYSTSTGMTHFLASTTISSAGGSDALGVYDASGLSARIATNGFYQSRPNSYGGTSDIKLKENVVDATPKLNDIMTVRVCNYNYKDEPGVKQIGVIAQELEQVFPGLVYETPDRDAEGNDLGTTTKSVKYSVFVPMLIKAIQEQQAIINQLKARLDAANL